jgi:hypothetical protein
VHVAVAADADADADHGTLLSGAAPGDEPRSHRSIMRMF